MPRVVPIVLALVLLVLPAGRAVAQGTVADLVPPRPAGFVTDVAGVISADAEARVEARLQRLRDSTGAEVAVVTLPSLGDAVAADVALAIGRAWGIGAEAQIGDARRNAGAVLLLVPRTDSTRGQVDLRSGTGAEGFLTDGRAGQILDAIVPALREQDYDLAVDGATVLLADLFARALGSQDSALVQPRSSGGPPTVMVIILVVVLVAAVGVAIAGAGGSGGGGPPGIRGGRRRPSPWLGPMGGGFGGGLVGVVLAVVVSAVVDSVGSVVGAALAAVAPGGVSDGLEQA